MSDETIRWTWNYSQVCLTPEPLLLTVKECCLPWLLAMWNHILVILIPNLSYMSLVRNLAILDIPSFLSEISLSSSSFFFFGMWIFVSLPLCWYLLLLHIDILPTSTLWVLLICLGVDFFGVYPIWCVWAYWRSVSLVKFGKFQAISSSKFFSALLFSLLFW